MYSPRITDSSSWHGFEVVTMWMDNWVLNTPLEHWPLYRSQKSPVLFRFFETRRPVVVLSSSNQANEETYEVQCRQQSVPILKRRGGGGTVVLGPGCLVLTFAFYARNIYGNQSYFSLINNLWINAISPYVNTAPTQMGISDICIGEKKIAGTSIFRKKHLLVYQGSLLVDADLNLISSLLQHPTREPEYRKGRNHSDFLTNMKTQGCSFGASELAIRCQTYFNQNVEEQLRQEFYINS